MLFWALITTACIGLNAAESPIKSSNQDCLQAGFDVDSLKCPTCEQMPKFGLAVLYDECKRCCTDEATPDVEKHHKAVIEVNEWILPDYPQIQSFVKGNMEKRFNGKVEVQREMVRRPQIRLKDAAGKTKQLLNIAAWTTDTLIEFLTQAV